tara:strand:- start:17584 stop:18075 length:492 start_codon:yes stop_codon:yes gene_type:complete
MGFTAAGISHTTVTTTQQAPLGFRLTVPQGDNGVAEYVYIKTAGAVAPGEIVGQSGVTPYLGVVTAANLEANKTFGVAQVTIASGSYGFVLAKGYCPIISTSSTSAPAVGAQITSAGSGIATDNAMNSDALVGANIGHQLTLGATDATIGGGNYGTAMIYCTG